MFVLGTIDDEQGKVCCQSGMVRRNTSASLDERAISIWGVGPLA